MTATQTRPTSELLDRAAATLGHRFTEQAMLHLALPCSDAVGLQAKRDLAGWEWRGFRVARLHSESCARLADLGWREGDTYLNLDESGPLEWVKPIRSGSRIITFGSDLLLGSPLLLLKPQHRSWALEAVTAALDGALRPGAQWRDEPVRQVPLGWAIG